ncbi:MAG TPA: hypothetical protein ENI63_01330 [Candidatus Kaiserbacteria bacterium]|nr:hypothetical protein [Candidatus Kaiserbacteria bacterium]
MNIFFGKQKTNKGTASGDLVLVTSIVLILGILWAISGGPKQTKNNTNIVNFKSNNSVTSKINSFFIPITREQSSNSNNRQIKAKEKYDEIIKDFGRIRNFGETSPYWGLVTIEKSSSGPKQNKPKDEYIILNISSKLRKPLTITGWKLQSMVTNRIVTIPKATKISTSGSVNIEQPIVVYPQDEVYLLTGYSPVGNSFQINKCSGYFEQFQDFTPSILKECPLPKDEFAFTKSDPLRFGDECLSYIEDLSRCNMPLEALPIGFPDSCVIFITEEINYSSCVKNHRNDDDFFKPQWRVYLKRNQELWNTRDIIRLLDADGKTVDVFSY